MLTSYELGSVGPTTGKLRGGLCGNGVLTAPRELTKLCSPTASTIRTLYELYFTEIHCVIQHSGMDMYKPALLDTMRQHSCPVAFTYRGTCSTLAGNCIGKHIIIPCSPLSPNILTHYPAAICRSAGFKVCFAITRSRSLEATPRLAVS